MHLQKMLSLKVPGLAVRCVGAATSMDILPYRFFSRAASKTLLVRLGIQQALGPDTLQNLGPDIIGTLPPGNQKSALFKIYSMG